MLLETFRFFRRRRALKVAQTIYLRDAFFGHRYESSDRKRDEASLARILGLSCISVPRFVRVVSPSANGSDR